MFIYYMVEMHYPLDADREAFNDFYHKHITMLLDIDGFESAQRFECTHEASAPFLAMYRLRDRDVLSRPSYTERAGRTSVDPAFRARMTNWDRNLVRTAAGPIELASDDWLVLLDRKQPASPTLPAAFTAMEIIGLDASIAERGIALGTGTPPDPANYTQQGSNVRVFTPVHPVRFPAA